ncbi:DUF1501 domain-containing protein [Prosthecobacter sp.]|uniref:DUF1501 domain-containing protein n=1 Tax=Prosthecobacter sp. TaxID=1965333 RepID=UPI0024871850|nr:DUF1501 domain-containing protein [Prosthecobacter sp.]MDI1313154.1 DUF1501 domain-containing protein [Prosthecobacter sp.]
MLTLLSRQSSSRCCDGLSRRSFLRIGGLGLGGLSFPDLLRAESAQGRGKSQKALIMVYLPGGPPHQDMYDIKTNAPSEVRSAFSPIATNVPGIQLCEHLPRMAKMADKLTFIRSVVGAKDRHESFQCVTGRLSNNAPPGGWPEIGSVVSKLKGGAPTVPGYVNLSQQMKHTPYNQGRPSFLGVSHAPFMPLERGKEDMSLNGVTLDRLENRRGLLSAFDNFRREADASGTMAGIDVFREQAMGILTSSRLVEALDLSKESPKIRERYGKGTDKIQGDAAPRLNEQFLLARRLVEAGVRVVTLSYSFWDWHGDNFKNAKANLPDFDQAISALVQDLHERGMDKDVTVLAWGEFGRTPLINNKGGRDHWPNVSCALLAGGGMQNGQVIGATDRLGGEATDRPVHFQEIFATLYNNLGINPHTSTVSDFSGRPHYLVDNEYLPIKELA